MMQTPQKKSDVTQCKTMLAVTVQSEGSDVCCIKHSLTYDDASWSSVQLHRLGVDPFAVRRLPHHLIGSLVALHTGIVQSWRAASAARPLKVLVVFGLSDKTHTPQG